VTDPTTLEAWRVRDFLTSQPGVRIVPHDGPALVIAGEFELDAQYGDRRIRDRYNLELTVPPEFPRILPSVRETGGRVPYDFHRYEGGELCLGIDVRLHLLIRGSPDLPTFFAECVVPYLYGFSHREQKGRLPFDELEHGYEGMVCDLRSILKVDNEAACMHMMRLAGTQRRKANHERCPCGSGKRVGSCHNRILNEIRASYGRMSCRSLYENLKAHRIRKKLVRERHEKELRRYMRHVA